jgi:hypothetical protein
MLLTEVEKENDGRRDSAERDEQDAEHEQRGANQAKQRAHSPGKHDGEDQDDNRNKDR